VRVWRDLQWQGVHTKAPESEQFSSKERYTQSDSTNCHVPRERDTHWDSQ